MFNKTKNKFYICLLGAFFLMPFSAAAGEIAFSDAASLQENDRYVVVLGSKPTDTAPSYVKQIQYDRIDINSFEAVIARSEGIRIDVAELRMGNNANLINKIYQAYELGLTILYFDAHHDKKLTDFRNTFLAENFAAENSNLRLKIVFNNKPLSQKIFTVSPNQLNAQSASASASLCNKRGILETGQVLSLLSAGAPYFKKIPGLAATPLNEPPAGAHNQVSAAAVPIFLILDVVAAIFNGARLIACADHTTKILSTAEVRIIAGGVVDDRFIRIMMNSIRSLGNELQRELYMIAGKDATVSTQELWIKDRLLEARGLYATLQELGYKASGLTAELAAIEIGLLKKLYKIHEKSNKKTQERIKDALAPKGTSPTVSYFKEQHQAFSAQEGSGERGRYKFLNTLAHRPIPGDLTCGPPGCVFRHFAIWGECEKDYRETATCFRSEFSANSWNHNDSLKKTNDHAYALARNYGNRQAAYLKNRYRAPRKTRALLDYSHYFYIKVLLLKANEYPSLEDLLGDFTGFNLAEHISIFEHFDQKGYEITLGVGRYTLPQLRKLGMRDNEISSLSVPKGLVVTVHQHEYFNGHSETYASNANVKGWFNDHISSIEVKKIDAITVYSNHDKNVIHDKLGSFTRGYAVRLPVGELTRADLEYRGIKDNDIASLQIPAGFTVTLYGLDNYKGWSKVYSGSTNLWSKYLNSASSIKIEYANAKNDFVHIRSMNGNGNYCLDADSSTANTNGGKVGIWPCVANSDAQKWKYDNKGRLVNKLSGKCMIVRWNQQNTPGAAVVVWDCNDTANRKWTLGHNGHNFVHDGGLCLDIPNAINAAGKQVVVYTCHDNKNQGWYFDKP